ncbi:nitrite reductase small subunit NirD [Sulfobacillus thermosulfidooxidans]|uniref:Assimilatory nitrite reductase (NAD(P)H) small subunit n=1 Tax=Sulfobacillus thermosulfidooxidans (strain DSM 9293 / VKM B-1269 / AT-1) TaxID=929705 RepID=A0A1W1WEN0_SULTA|nr:nitrite reductase small subunit NirD [Sulfobacillus thermosulfidooxidans]OLZ11339.1 hypothetical protein BFX05_07620 [Sulfobacillus thermosulfidooxidans]OLZ14063.1 hypothetical protein BFX06_07060 [Sulfobacillus thermosulfidooxidans]OLZ19845.1 hypothetical protein BFX07_01800 [Sulfobacillus thermosulfidooxidans]SMC04758.1 assimilatory nitrite reductase (NAD(P)H) small subunit [Sulfobacillus thermosulfidooxidans DSM 9293]
MAWIKVLRFSDVAPQTGRKVIVGNCHLAVFRLRDGTLRAIANQCPHRQGSLADGIVSGHHVYCPLHDWKINLDNGCAEAPDQGETSVFPVKVVEDNIYIELDDMALAMCTGVSQTVLSQSE